MNKKITSHLLTKENDSPILGKGNDKGQHINTDFLNILQAVEWEIDEEILPYIKDTLKAPSEDLTPLEVSEREKGFIHLQRETDVVIDYLLENNNSFFFGWKYDKRGRSYSQGYHCNPQGNAYRKAMLSYKHSEELTTKGIKYLKLDIANTYGYDKLTYFERITRANRLIKNIFLNGTLDETQMLAEAHRADDQELFIKAILAYNNGVILCKPINHRVGFDATASGIQLMSAMAGCTVGGANSNVNPHIIREMTDEANEKILELERELANA